MTASIYSLRSTYEASIVSKINLVPFCRKIFGQSKLEKEALTRFWLIYVSLFEKCEHF